MTEQLNVKSKTLFCDNYFCRLTSTRFAGEQTCLRSVIYYDLVGGNDDHRWHSKLDSEFANER